jgi:hypothetical protein
MTKGAPGMSHQFATNGSQISIPQRPVQRAVVDGFQDVIPRDAFAAFEIGQRAGHFQDAVMRPGAEVLPRHRLLEIPRAFAVEFAMFANETWAHPAVGVNPFFLGKALALDGASFFHPQSDQFRRFRQFRRRKRLVFHRRDFHVQIDPVQQRTADALAVFLN